jgi:hypothetical protein
MTKLTRAQTEILTAIAASQDGAMDAPAGTKDSVKTLIKRGLLISLSRPDLPNQLSITDAGRTAIGGEPDQANAGAVPPPEVTPATSVTSQPKGKIAILVSLLEQPAGATIDAMMSATGWQAHSVRGAISGSIKKNLGRLVSTEKTDAGRIYRIAEQA